MNERTHERMAASVEIAAARIARSTSRQPD